MAVNLSKIESKRSGIPVWRWLTEPAASIPKGNRRNARLLSALLAILTLSTGLNVLAGILSTTSEGPSPIFIVVFVLVFGTYGLSRTKHHGLAAVLIILAVSLPSFSRVFSGDTEFTEAGIRASLGWLVLPLLLSSLLLSIRGTAVVAILNFVGILLLPRLTPGLEPQVTIGSLGYFGTLSVLVLLAMGHRNLQERDRQAELRASAEEARRAMQEAREASRLKSEFLAVMSHELRTPLNAIIGFAGIMLLEASNGKYRHMTERIRANSERLLTLIDDILDISRIESGRLELVPVPLSLRRVAEEIRSEMAVLAEQKGLAFSATVSDDVPQEVMLDEEAIIKMLTNLVSNGFKFTNEGSVQLRIHREQSELVFEAIDTGIGIPAHMQQIIFESFRQVDGSTTREHGGAGLGLSIVRHLCSAMNGTVTVSSDVGEGSTFTIRLPFEEAREMAGAIAQ
jgi:signal transduction histidine kinase